MADIIFRYGGQGAAPYGDPFTVRESWPEWQKSVWINALAGNGYAPQSAPWVPTYEQGSVSWPGNDGQMQSAPLDQYEIPTLETANTLAARYAVDGKPLHVLELPWIGPGPAASSAVARYLQWPNLATLPVNQLAKYYSLNPEDKSTAADVLCKILIARVWPTVV